MAKQQAPQANTMIVGAPTLKYVNQIRPLTIKLYHTVRWMLDKDSQ